VHCRLSREIIPSTRAQVCLSACECDCGHRSHFFENTIRDIKAMSRKKRVRLGDSTPDEHISVFYKGEMVDIICPSRPAGSAKT
jgi:hypothetical protein